MSATALQAVRPSPIASLIARGARRMSLRRRFLVAPLLGLVVCSLLTGTFVHEAWRQNALLSRITEQDMRTFDRYAEVFGNLTEQHSALGVLLDSAGGMDEATLYQRGKQHLYRVQQAVRDLEAALPAIDGSVTPGFAAMRDKVAADARAYSAGAGAAIAMATVDSAHAAGRLAITNQRFIAVNHSFVAFRTLQRNVISEEIAARVRQNQIGNTTIALVGMSIAFLVFFLSLLLSRMLSRSIEAQIGILADLGAQAGAHAPIEGSDEVERMAQAIGAFRLSLLELRDNEHHLGRLNRVYAVLSGINTLIVRVRDRDELFREACRIAVDHGQFKAAMIGVLDRETMQARPVASAGAGEGFLAALRPRLGLRPGDPAGLGLVAQAFREKKPVVVNDVEHDPRVLQKKECIEHGIHSMGILPLLVAGNPVGVLALFAGERGFFDDEKEMKLLRELAGDIAFALDHLEKEAKLDYLAYYDSLTGLANRSLFLERVAQHVRGAASGGHKLAVFLVDLERFKNINDSLGQAAGDALLKQVGEWITRSVGDASFVARLGADHFAVVLPQVKEEGSVVRLVEKTLEAFFEHPFRLDDAVLRIAAKVGVAIFPDDGSDADALLKNAEAALKKSKASGARYLFYTRRMTETVAAALTLENQLRRALDNEEFLLHYQPKVSLASGKVTGAEALIRWNDPATGLVPPGRFIPVLEETGLIHEVGRWALRKAIEDYLRWRAAGLAAVRIAVNVSPLQLRNRGFAEEIRRVIAVDPHAAAGLELELTESLIMEDVKHNIASLQAIRDMGVKIAIDDFGTGFSSLSYLARLPVDTLKVDRSFVTDMTVSPEGLALVRTIISLAHSLKLGVVAEGVETEEQSRLLRLLSCDEMQGFHFAKPVAFETFESRFLAPLQEGRAAPMRAAVSSALGTT